MNKPKPGALFIQAWLSETASVARKPSWIARRTVSTKPPTSGHAPQSTPAPVEPREGAVTSSERAPQAEEPPVRVSVPGPPPPAPVDISASIALAQLSEENAALRTQITEMAATMARLRREVLEASEGELVRLALAVAERVVGRELQMDPALVVAWARESVEALAAKDGVVIALARDVRDAVPADAWQDMGVEHRVQADSQLGPGVVEVRTPEGTVRTGPAARLSAVGKALGVGDP
jgi:hypothetical protein